ncbi:MAG: DUF2911 domain-containing protein [Bacteroidota bacterium]
MKSKVLYTLVSFVFLCSVAIAQQSRVYVSRPSAAAEIKQKVGVTDVIINYSRPQVILPNGNDRTGQIYGTVLAHYGLANPYPTFGSGESFPWRAGANENTTITFSTDVKIEGQPLKAGTYGFFIELSEDGNETLIFSENATSWGSFFYKKEEEVLRVKIKSQSTDFTNILTYDFESISTADAVIVLKWENKKFPFKLEVATNDLILTEYRSKLPEWNDPKEYMMAANFCLQNRINYEEGMSWIEKALEAGIDFRRLGIKGGLIYRTNGMDAALPILDQAAKIANQAELNSLAYQLMQLGNTEKAMEYFKLNVKRHPDNANGYDSLGDGYAALGEREKAIESYQKAISMDPPRPIKDHAIAQLKKLGVDYN